MECIDVSKFLIPAFAILLLLSWFSVWRMKANAIRGYDKKIERMSVWNKLISDYVIPKSLLSERGKLWRKVSVLAGIGLIVFFLSYVYFNNQDWVCDLGPEKSPIEAFKNMFSFNS